ncbi:glycosyltransferase [Methylobacterium thuringiense]|uniref:D-inositol-3-phosphate glycosyltransferase n=1 Tax=Methylobacterium thuringiense TaxID=1003091 RepID=A0ABQ4TJI2_9HYPH|nr:glycosyltransferase [Methylobacterium thuringiense]GJE55555.1 D-inositol-3-phosphate glycosyltransferase [Methylobacterium thuringiense]
MRSVLKGDGAKSPRLNLLVLSFFPANVPPTSGGETRLFELYSALSHHHSVRLISSAWSDLPTTTVRHGTNFREIRVRKPAAVNQIFTELSAFSNSGADVSGPMVYKAGFTPNEMHQVYFDQYEGADVIIHDSPFTISYDVMAGADLIPRIYNSYNCETQLYAQMHPDESAAPIRDLVREAELRLLACVDLVTTCSTEDMDLIACLTDRQIRKILVPNGGNNHRTMRKEPTHGQPQAIFVGSSHQPNREAAHFVATKLAPELPNVTFQITGNCLPEGCYPSNVRRQGFVSDETKRELLRSCDIALNPMVAGGGSNLKFTDYLSYGIPVLSTRFGVRGLGLAPGFEYLEADRENFGAVLADALRDPSRLNEIGRAGRLRFQQSLSWTSIATQFADEIKVVSQERRHRTAAPVLAINDYDFSLMKSGGAMRIRGLYERMRHEREVFYVVLTDSREWTIDRSAQGMTIFKVPKAQDHRVEEARIEGQYHLSAADIVGLYMHQSNYFLVKLVELLKKQTICIITDHIYVASLVGPEDVWIYSSQNHEASLKAEILAQHPSRDFLVEKVIAAEDDAMCRAALVVCVSEDDAAKMVAGRKSSVPTIVIPNGILPSDPIYLNEAASISIKVADRSCIFIGSSHPPNILACIFIVEKLAPSLPDVEFHLIGSVCEGLESRLPGNVHLWGRLDEPHKIAFAHACRLALNPVNTGGGSNVKIADYFSHGLPVVSTSFGMRGFPAEVAMEVEVCELGGFAEAVERILAVPADPMGIASRKYLFKKYFDAAALGQTLADAVSALPVPRRRILFVTYRLTYPPRGGAEVHLLKLIEILARTGRYDIDIVAPDVDAIGEEGRFGGTYASDPLTSGPFGLPHVHWARFPLDTSQPKGISETLVRMWEAQAAFERVLVGSFSELNGSEPLLLWGWSTAEGTATVEGCWLSTEAALFAPEAGRLTLAGLAPAACVISSASDSATAFGPRHINGRFELEMDLAPGVFSLRISSELPPTTDPRPLGVFAEVIAFNGQPIPPRNVKAMPSADPDDTIERLAEIARETRRGCSLTDVRGPFSSALESWIELNVKSYDLLLTHNNIFRPVVRSLEIAAAKGVPSVLVPHAHLDDDYYHFPDMVASVQQASAVLAAPLAAVRYLRRLNPMVHYHSPGVDVVEVPTVSDDQAFRRIYPGAEPFVLVLGRKAGAKNYRWIIDAAKEAGLRIVMIGPDDDGAPISDTHVNYLGQQPRTIVRGALAACLFLTNMSSSESFGMVILEAWLARRAVIANRNCAAFQDLVRHGETGLLASRDDLASVMRILTADSALRGALAEAGYQEAAGYDWSVIGAAFEQMCCEVMARRVSDEAVA